MKPIILQLPTLIFSIVYLNIASTCQPVIISLYAVMWVAFKNIYIPIITLTCSTSRRIFFIPLAKSSSFILRLVWIMPRLSFAHNYYSPIKLNFHSFRIALNISSTLSNKSYRLSKSAVELLANLRSTISI